VNVPARLSDFLFPSLPFGSALPCWQSGRGGVTSNHDQWPQTSAWSRVLTACNVECDVLLFLLPFLCGLLLLVLPYAVPLSIPSLRPDASLLTIGCRCTESVFHPPSHPTCWVIGGSGVRQFKRVASSIVASHHVLSHE